MDEFALTRSVVRDLQDAGTLFTRRLCSITVLKLHFDRSASKLRWFAPDNATAIAQFGAELDEIVRDPPNKQYVRVMELLERVDAWGKRPSAAPARTGTPAPAIAVPRAKTDLVTGAPARPVEPVPVPVPVTVTAPEPEPEPDPVVVVVADAVADVVVDAVPAVVVDPVDAIPVAPVAERSGSLDPVVPVAAPRPRPVFLALPTPGDQPPPPPDLDPGVADADVDVVDPRHRFGAVAR